MVSTSPKIAVPATHSYSKEQTEPDHAGGQPTDPPVIGEDGFIDMPFVRVYYENLGISAEAAEVIMGSWAS